MRYKGRHTEFKKLLIQRLALIIAVIYLLSPLQQQISAVLHSLSHDLSLPDYVMTHSHDFSNENNEAHQYGDHRTDEITHEHQFIDFVQSLIKNTSQNEQQSDPKVPTKSIDKHLVIYGYKLETEYKVNHINIPVGPGQNTRIGHSDLWQEPPIGVLL